MPGEKRIPNRRCVSCMQHFDKRELVRVLRTPEGTVILDTVGRQNGRGAYVCKTPACLKKLRKNRRLEHALGVSIPDGVYAELEELANAGG